jgi:hypothetical protein
MGRTLGGNEVGNVEGHLVLIPGGDDEATVFPRSCNGWTGIFARLCLTVVHHVWSMIELLFSASGRSEAWIAGTRTVGRVGAVHNAGSVQFEGIWGLSRPDSIYLDGTRQMLD